MSIHSYHYWIFTKDKDGRMYLIYGCPARDGEDKARQRGMELLGSVDFELKRYPTSSIQAASSMARGSRLNETHSLEISKKRIGHNKSISRLKKRMSIDNSDNNIW